MPPDQPLSPPSNVRVTFSSFSAPSGSRSGSSLTILASSASESSTLGVPRTLIDATAELEVGGVGLEHVGRERQHLFLQLPRPVEDDAVRHGGRPAAAGADQRHGRDVGVAEDDMDVLELDAQLVDGDLGERRLVALAVRLLAGDDLDDAVVLDRDVRDLVAEDAVARRRSRHPGSGRGLEVRRDAEPEVAPVGERLGLAAAEAVPVDGRRSLFDALAGWSHRRTAVR